MFDVGDPLRVPVRALWSRFHVDVLCFTSILELPLNLTRVGVELLVADVSLRVDVMNKCPSNRHLHAIFNAFRADRNQNKVTDAHCPSSPFFTFVSDLYDKHLCSTSVFSFLHAEVHPSSWNRRPWLHSAVQSETCWLLTTADENTFPYWKDDGIRLSASHGNKKSNSMQYRCVKYVNEM